MSENNEALRVVDFDPNLSMCGRKAKFTVRVTVALWEFRAQFEAIVTGNVWGFDVIECALEHVWKSLDAVDEAGECATMTLTAADGDTCEIQDDEEEGLDWFRNYVIGVEVINAEHVPGHGVAYFPRSKDDVSGTLSHG